MLSTTAQRLCFHFCIFKIFNKFFDLSTLLCLTTWLFFIYNNLYKSNMPYDSHYSSDSDASDEGEKYEAFIAPRNHTQPKMQLCYNETLSYVNVCRTRILAEFWAMFEQRSGSRRGWCERELDDYKVDLVRRSGNTVYVDCGLDDTGATRNLELNHHFCVFEGKLCVAKSTGVGEVLRLFMGRSLRDYDKEDVSILPTTGYYNVSTLYSARSTEHMIYSYGYIGDYIRELHACDELIESECFPPILHSIANPRVRRNLTYPLETWSEKVPINKGQEDALARLAHDVEAIRGPPEPASPPPFFTWSTPVPRAPNVPWSCASRTEQSMQSPTSFATLMWSAFLCDWEP